MKKKQKKKHLAIGPVSLTWAEDMLKSEVIEEKKLKKIESEWFGPRSINDLWYS